MPRHRWASAAETTVNGWNVGHRRKDCATVAFSKTLQLITYLFHSYVDSAVHHRCMLEQWMRVAIHGVFTFPFVPPGAGLFLKEAGLFAQAFH